MRSLKKYMPLFVAGFIVVVGALNFGAVSIDSLLFEAETPGNYVLMGIAVAFMMLGSFFIYQFQRGQLKKRGATVAEVRMRAVEKMNDRPLLTNIAREDPNSAVRQKAVERLKQLGD